MRTIALALALGWIAAAPARAQSDGAPAEYQALIDAAVAEFGAGRWPEARAMFQRAHDSFPNARTLRGLGMSSFEMRDYPEAARALEAALASSVRPLTEEQRVQVTSLLARARALIGRFRVPAAPEGSRLYVDGAGMSAGQDWPAREGALLLAVGRHEIAIRSEGRSAHATIDVRGGEDALLDIDLAALRAATAPARGPSAAMSTGSGLDPPRPSTTSEGRSAADGTGLDGVPAASAAADRGAADGTAARGRAADRAGADDTAAWVLLGAGAGLAALGVVLFAIGAADVDAAMNAAAGTPWPEVRERAERAPILTGTGAALLGVGGATALIGLIWALSNDPGQERERVAGTRIDLGLGSLSIRGSF